MAKVYLDVGETWLQATDNTKIAGSTSMETVTIIMDVTGVTIDQSIEAVDLSAQVGIRFLQTGNQLQVFSADGTAPLTSITLQIDSDGTLLALPGADAPISALFSTTTGDMTIGDAIISKTTPMPLSVESQTVTESVTETGNYDATTTDTLFQFAPGTYDYTIEGFAVRDVLDFPDGAVISVTNTDFNDGNVDVQSVVASGKTMTIHLSGLATPESFELSSLDGFNAVFGAGSLI